MSIELICTGCKWHGTAEDLEAFKGVTPGGCPFCASPVQPAAFHCIAADPPWMERGAGKVKRGADRHYPLMHRSEILRTMAKDPLWRPADDAHLWLWATSNHLQDAMWLIDALGFRYVTQAVWIKVRKRATPDNIKFHGLGNAEDVAQAFQGVIANGMGQYVRGGHELLLLGTRGRGAQIRTPARNLSSVIVAPVGEHSAKPQAAFDFIEARSIGPRAEFFARHPRIGWQVMGNEI